MSADGLRTDTEPPFARTRSPEFLGVSDTNTHAARTGTHAPVLRIAASGVRSRPRERLVVPPAVSDYEADDERNRGDHNGGDHEKAEQHAPTCEGHDDSFRVR